MINYFKPLSGDILLLTKTIMISAKVFILLFAIGDVFAKECVLRRLGFMVENPDYRAPQTHILYQAQPQMDTNITLFRLKNDSTLIFDLAEQVSVDEDKQTLQVKLKRSCGWSDGQVIDAHHMLKGIKLYFEQKEFPTALNNLFKNSDVMLKKAGGSSGLGVRVIDDFTLEFDLVSPPELLMQALSYPAFTPAPIHLMQKKPSSWPVKSIIRVSSGPYKAIVYEPEKKIEMVKNPYYCKGVVSYFDRVVFVGRKQHHRSFSRDVLLDNVDVALEVNSNQADSIVKNYSQSHQYTVGNYPEDNTVSLFINPEKLATKEAKIRKAIYLAINHELINRAVSPEGRSQKKMGISVSYSGYEQVYLSKFSSLSDEKRLLIAKALMGSLGYGPTNRLKLKLLGYSGELYNKTQSVLVSMLSRAYIDVIVDSKTEDQYWESIKRHDYHMALLGWSADYPDPSNFLEGTLASMNLPQVLSNQYRQRLKASYRLFDREKRMQQLAQIEKQILETFYIIPLFRYQRYYLLKPGFVSLGEPMLTASSIVNKNCTASPNKNR